MKLQFTVQEYQTRAVDAVVDCFAGQPKHDGISYRIDPGRRSGHEPVYADAGLRNAEIALGPDQLLENIQGVLRGRNLLPVSGRLAASEAAPGAPGHPAPNLTVEMETGTGKTYVYGA